MPKREPVELRRVREQVRVALRLLWCESSDGDAFFSACEILADVAGLPNDMTQRLRELRPIDVAEAIRKHNERERANDGPTTNP